MLCLTRALLALQVISPTKAKAPAPPGKGNQGILGEDNTVNNNGDGAQATFQGSGAPAWKTQFISTSDGGLPETIDSAATAGAAEIAQLENLVTMGDGKHDSFTCHCWGLENTLWAVNEPGQLVRNGYIVHTVKKNLGITNCKYSSHKGTTRHVQYLKTPDRWIKQPP